MIFLALVAAIAACICTSAGASFGLTSSLLAEGEFYSANQRLFEDLMTNYSKELAPYYTLRRKLPSHPKALKKHWDHPLPMTTEVALTYVRIVKLDQMEQVMRVIAEIRYVWSDYRLRWDPADYAGIEYIYISRTKIWVPEITVANSEATTDAVPEYKQNVLVNYTGHVLYYNNVLANSVCQLETTDFPFDEQQCSFCLLESLFNKNESKIDVSIGERVSGNIHHTGNGEWDVLDIDIQRLTIQEYHRVEFDLMCYKFHLKRKANFYVMVIIIPTFIITTLSITGIFGKRLTADDFIGELSLGLTSLMTMTVMLGIVADSLPKTNHLPILSVFLTIDVSLMALSVLVVIMHPRIIYPKYRKIKSKVFTSHQSEGEEKPSTCCFGFIPKKYRSANLVFMVVFQGINCANLYYLMSFWSSSHEDAH